MAEIKFGRNQLGNPTPSKLGDIIQVYTVVASILLAWIGTANFIPIQLSGVLQSILGLTVGLANGIKPFFGVETTASEVPIENVTAMDAGEKKEVTSQPK